MKQSPSRCSSSQTIQCAATDTTSIVVTDSCFILPHDPFERRRLVRALIQIAPSLEYVLGSRDDVLIRCELAGMHFLEVRSLKALQLIETIADINDYCLSENEIIILQHNLYVYGSRMPWYPALDWLERSTEWER